MNKSFLRKDPSKKEMRILAIIPARSGSKRLPGKNIKQLGDAPLIAWTIESALDASFERLIVSTDDEVIAKIAIKNGAKVPFMRSPKYASDEASVIDVAIEALDFFEKENTYFSAVLLLQPTSPFRTVESIQSAIELFDGVESVVSVSPACTHPYWCKKVEDGVLLPFSGSYDTSLRSQDLPEAYQLNGSIYLASVKTLRERKSFYSEHTKALVVDSEEEALDIDTPFDWMIAEAIAEKRKNK